MKAILKVDEPATGLHNMDVDEAMLRDAEHCRSLVLRIYRWENPTLSLGHFQRNSDITSNETWAKLDRVVRKTGGGAIVHDRELTYSLVIPHLQQKSGGNNKSAERATEIPPAFGTKGPSEMVYRAIHLGLVSGLRELRLDAGLAEECTCKVDGVAANQSFLCFERRSPVDIVIGGHKVVGSAQRRTQFGLLQHGSVLLRSSIHAPHLAGILDILDSTTQNEQSNSKLTGHPTVSSLAGQVGRVSGTPESESLDWEKWTAWLAKNLQVSLEKAFAGYWLFG